MSWEDDSRWEAEWWGNCCNTFGEEYKQIAYARRMGLKFFHDGKSPFNIDMKGKAVVDIGGGPCSLLLKCVNLGPSLVVDPCLYPEWTVRRYHEAGIGVSTVRGEEISRSRDGCFDEAWIYNVLQHTNNPETVIENARKVSTIIRLFEWVDTQITPGHPHVLTEKVLNELLMGEGKVDNINENTAVGKCYYGIFKGDRYGL